MRPTSIVAFERLALLSIALDGLNFAARWQQLVASGHAGLGVATDIFTIVFQLALILIVSRFGSRICKWAIVILTTVGIVDFLVTGFRDDGTQLWKSIYLLQMILAAVGLVLLVCDEGGGAQSEGDLKSAAHPFQTREDRNCSRYRANKMA